MEDDVHILYPLETLIRGAAARDSSMLDLHVIDALGAARRTFMAEGEGRTFRPTNLDERSVKLLVGLHAIGQFLLGHDVPNLEVKIPQPQQPVAREALIAAIKRLEKSVHLWTERGGRKGYLEYIEQFLPS